MHALLLMAAAGLVGLTAAAAAQEYPTKPVRLIIPFPPGGSNDVVGRMIATKLSERLGKLVVVDNRAGAGGVIGTELAANAPKDGYTLLFASIAHAINPWLYKLPYDAHKAFVPIAGIASSPNALAIHPDLPAKTLKEFIALAKAKPGELQYASGGVGGNLHLSFELFKQTAGVDLLHVPFRGGGPAVIDVIGGHTKALIATLTTVVPHVRSGKLRAIAVSAAKRSPALPDVPTFTEAGLPGYEAGNWIGIVAPAGTPDAIVAKLEKEIAAVRDSPEFEKQLVIHAAVGMRMSATEFGAYMEQEMAKWGRIVKESGIKPQ
jgi:tripartite-type tricarboxylate transporter receptor subunit TctC